MHGGPACSPDLVSGREPGAHDDIGLSVTDGLEKAASILGCMLAVCIYLHGGRVATRCSEAEPTAQRGPNPQVERMLEDEGPSRHCLAGGAIGRPVIDDEDIAVKLCQDGSHDGPDRLLLVQCGDDDQ